VEEVKAAVVNVDVKARAGGGRAQASPFDRFFGGPDDRPRGGPVRQGAGSGFVIEPRGLVLTNNHVVENAVSIRVRLGDGRTFEARILGRDPLTDLALLRLQDVKEDLPTVALGDSDAMRVGDWVMAIGNPFGLASSVSAGIISARARDIQAGPYDDFLQTDAAINPGNSGGPLFNLAGQVIGINTAIVGGGTGIGFAVPSNMARALLPQLEKGQVRRGWLGVAVQDLEPDLAKAMKLSRTEGAILTEVSPETPAAEAGLRTEDVVVALDGEPVASSRELTRRVGLLTPGEEVTLTVLREGKERQVALKLGERPDYEGVGNTVPASGEAEASRAESLGLALQDAVGERRPAVQPRFPWEGLRRGGEVEPLGALVAGVSPGSAADEAGLAPGMVVVEAAGKRVARARDLWAALRDADPGSTLLLKVRVQDRVVLRALPIP
jgi:serine protease Do